MCQTKITLYPQISTCSPVFRLDSELLSEAANHTHAKSFLVLAHPISTAPIDANLIIWSVKTTLLSVQTGKAVVRL